MSKSQINIILNNQANLILELITAINFLRNFPKYLEFIEHQEPKSLWFIHNTIRDSSIIKLTQLFHGKENYSFNKLRSVLKKQTDLDEKLMIKFDSEIKPGNKLFSQLKILKISNEHVGHLLPKRTLLSIDWDLANNLVQVAIKLHDLVNQEIFGTISYWFFDEDILCEIYSNDLQSRETFKLWRQMFHEGQKEIKREEFEKLVDLKWPMNK